MLLDGKKLEDLQTAADIIKSGGIVGVPTETVYGLAANALNATAVRKIFEAKGRPFIDPLIAHVHSFAELEKIAEANPQARKLAEAFSPGPITYVLPKKPCVPDIVSAGMPTVAVRIPVHPVMQEFMRIVGVPLSAPSANPFGYVSPTTAEHVMAQLGAKIDAVIDGGQCDCGVESTIVSLTNPQKPVLLRPGPIARELIEEVLKCEVAYPKDKNPAIPEAPGMLKSHYSPRAKVVLFDDVLPKFEAGAAVIYFARPKNPQADEFWLSEDGNVKEGARNLFSLLRLLDTNFKKIYCQRFPNNGVGEAANDRLSRAAAK